VPQLSSDRIVATALELADREGLDAVTLRRLATELGVHVTSLYNHVATRDAIVDGIIELLISEAELPGSPRTWEEWVRTFVAAIGALAESHPGAFAALERRPVQGERALSSFEAALAAFERAGLSSSEAYSAVKATTYIALAIGLERALAARGETAETETDLLSPDRFPHVLALASVDDPGQTTWAFSVETLVAGLHTQVRRAKRR
jgi:AcrR family transcriptional regulator